MRLLEKHKNIEDVGIQERSRYSRKAEYYCYQRSEEAKTPEYELFWINMHYMYGLMTEKNPTRYL